MNGECSKCGGKLIWGGMSWVEHTDGHHAARRRLLLKSVARRLHEEVRFREQARIAAQWGMIRIQWRVTCLLGERRDMWGGVISGSMWDALTTDDRQVFIAMLGRELRDEIQQTFRIRPHPMHVKYRIFDERG